MKYQSFMHKQQNLLMGQTIISKRDLSIDHPFFQKASLIKTNTQEFIETEIPMEEKEYERWRKALKTSEVKGQYLFLPLKWQFAASTMCGESGTAKIHYPNYPLLLQDQIEDRHYRKELFDQTQLWFLLFNLISAKKAMKPVDNKIGDIRPKNIFMNEVGEIKVANLHSWPKASTNFTKSLQGSTTYLAPEQLLQLKNKNLQTPTSNLAEAFSIGLTILSAAVLQNLQTLYDTTAYEMNKQMLKINLDTMKAKPSYSQVLKSTISNLCKLSPQERMEPEEIWQLVEKHGEKIRKKEIFVIDEAPSKLHNEVKELRQYMPLLQKTFQRASILGQSQKRSIPVSSQFMNSSKTMKHQNVEPVNFTKSWQQTPQQSPVKRV